MEIELSSILTVTGAAASAALITTLIEVLKTAFHSAISGHEQALALLFSLVFVSVAFVDAAVYTLPAIFTAFVAWLMIAKVATGIHDEVTAAPGSFRSGE